MMIGARNGVAVLAAVAIVVVAVARAQERGDVAVVVASSSVDTVAPTDVPDPSSEVGVLPSGYLELAPRDAIRPVYAPEFVRGGDVDWDAASLVIGVVGPRSVKAYPVGFLHRREMVIDMLDGTPILVSW